MLVGTAVAVAEPVAPGDLPAAVAAARPGQTITIAAGTWSDQSLLLKGEGTAKQPIVVRAERPGATVLTGASRLRIAGRHLVVDGLTFRDGGITGEVIQFRADSRTVAESCRLTRCAIVDYNPDDPQTETKWVSLYGRHHRVDHCRFEGKTNGGTTVVVWVGPRPDEHRLDHNLFGPRPRLGRNGGETIRIGTSEVSMSPSRTVVEDNLFVGCDGEVETISNKSGENVYRRNTFRRCSGTLTLRHGNRCRVEGNWFFGEGARGTGGVRVIGEEHLVINNYLADLQGTGSRSALSVMQGIADSPLSGYFQVKGLRLLHNTVVGCRSPLEIGTPGEGTSLPPDGALVANNLFQGEPGCPIRLVLPPVNWRWSGNQCAGPPPPDGIASGLGLFPTLLARCPDGLWRPGADSPAIDAAAPAPDAPEQDLDGRPRGDRPDVGCFERGDGPARFRPLTEADVGPTAAE